MLFGFCSVAQQIPALHQVCRETDARQNLIKSLLCSSFSVANLLCFQEVGRISNIFSRYSFPFSFFFPFPFGRASSSSSICVICKLLLHGSQFPKKKETN